METVETINEFEAIVADMRARLDPEEFARRMAQWRATCAADDAASEVARKRQDIQKLRDTGRALADALNTLPGLATSFDLAKTPFLACDVPEVVELLASDLPERVKQISPWQFGGDVERANARLTDQIVALEAELPQ